MAVEGSLALPIFLFFMMTLLMTLEVVRFQANVQEALHQAGNNMAFHGYRGEEIFQGEGDAEMQIREYLDQQLFPYLCIAGGKEGVRLNTSKGADGRIQIQAEYEIRPFIASLPIGKIVIQDQMTSHQWIGYRGGAFTASPGKEEIYVYVTEHGTRYHLQADCTYLRISVKMVSSEELDSCRNQSGGIYDPCQRCKPKSSQIVYLTADGTSYHSQADCPSLKRTVHRIPLREAGAYGCCSKCGGAQ